MSGPQYLDRYLPPEGTLIPGAVVPRRRFAENPISPDVHYREYDRNYDVPADPRAYAPQVAVRTAYTNYLKQSDNLGHADWNALNLTVTADNFTTPWDGSTAVDKLLETVTNAEHRVSQAYTFTAVPHILWAVVRLIGRTYLRLLANDGTTSFSAFFDVPSLSVFSKSSGVTAALTLLDDSFALVSIAFTPAAAAGNVYLNTSTDGSTVSFVGDVTKGAYVAHLQLERASAIGPRIQTSTASRAVSSPNIDPVDPFAFLLAETDPAQESTQTARVRRTFGRIPRQQVSPTSVMVDKSSVTGSFPQLVGSYILVKPDSTLDLLDAYYRQLVTSDSGAPALYPTGGTYDLAFDGDTASGISYSASSATVDTALDALGAVIDRDLVTVSGSYNSSGGFTVTFASYAAINQDLTSVTGAPSRTGSMSLSNGGYTQVYTATANSGSFSGGTIGGTIFGQTFSVAYNASAATVEAALEALSEVADRGGVTVTLPSGATTILETSTQIRFTVQFSNPLIVATASSLTIAGSTITVSSADGGINRIQTLVFSAGPTSIRTIYCENHGLTTADTLCIKADSTYRPDITAFTLPDVDTIALAIAPGLAWASASAITEVGKRTKRNYASGSDDARAELVTDFYLVGVTFGADTAADIPVATYQGAPAVLLQAILAGTGDINYRVGDLQQHKGAIMSRAVTRLDAAKL